MRFKSSFSVAFFVAVTFALLIGWPGPSLSAGATVDETIFKKTYDFHPRELSKEQITAMSAKLDKLWAKVEAKPKKYLPILRRELASSDRPPFFYFDGSKLLLHLSKTPEDAKLILSALTKVDIRDIQPTDYLRTVHWLAVKGYDTTDAAQGRALSTENYRPP